MSSIDAATSVGPFFVAGTGRSGTTQLRRVIGGHPLVHGIEWESRFLVDPGGFADLVDVLTKRYDPYRADDALRRLAALLEGRVAGRNVFEVFAEWDLPGEVGRQRWRAALNALWRALVWYEFDESVPPLDVMIGGDLHPPGQPRTHRRVVARRFPDRADLVEVVRRFVSDVFDPLAAEHGKQGWCEKTPFNLLAIPFLWEVFPTARVAVAVRHPSQVVASHLHQGWAPDDLTGALNWVESIYLEWLDQRDKLVGDARYSEWHIEDLARDWEQQRPRLFAALGLDDADTPDRYNPDHAESRAAQLGPDELTQVQDRLAPVISALGYEPLSRPLTNQPIV